MRGGKVTRRPGRPHSQMCPAYLDGAGGSSPSPQLLRTLCFKRLRRTSEKNSPKLMRAAYRGRGARYLLAKR